MLTYGVQPLHIPNLNPHRNVNAILQYLIGRAKVIKLLSMKKIPRLCHRATGTSLYERTESVAQGSLWRAQS